MGNPAQNTWYIIDEHCAMLSFGDTFMVTFMWLRRYFLVSIHHMCCRRFDLENPLYPLRSSVGFLVHYFVFPLMFCCGWLLCFVHIWLQQSQASSLTPYVSLLCKCRCYYNSFSGVGMWVWGLNICHVCLHKLHLQLCCHVIKKSVVQLCLAIVIDEMC